MMVAILGITGFQLYWLRQNYVREKKTLELKAGNAFRESMQKLQAAKLRLDGVEWSQTTDKPAVRIFMQHETDSLKVKVKPRAEVISTINVIRDKMLDSLRKTAKKGVIISMNKTLMDIQSRDSLPPVPSKDYIFNLLYGVDSLQDSIRVQEIDSALTARFRAEKLQVPFTVIRLDSSRNQALPGEDVTLKLTRTGGQERLIIERQNQFTIGFAHPVTYEFRLGNSFPYLVRQILQPILFSVLLLAITILSFVMLYRNMRRQQRLAELKNEFISNITHELKTPIATVGVAIEALRNFNAMDNPQRTREYLDISANELQRLSLLVDKVLKLSMFEKKEIDLKYEMLNLRELVQEVVASLRLQIERHQASVTITQEGDVTLPADRLHMLSVVFNLLDNALKYTGDNPRIQILLRGKTDEVELIVSDNGIGIPEEYRDKIFEKFFRVPHGDTHDAKGYGLGLSYTAQVVRKHKGSIRVESEAGKGTRFLISLPKTIQV